MALSKPAVQFLQLQLPNDTNASPLRWEREAGSRKRSPCCKAGFAFFGSCMGEGILWTGTIFTEDNFAQKIFATFGMPKAQPATLQQGVVHVQVDREGIWLEGSKWIR